MGNRELLSPQEIEQELKALPGWKSLGGKLRRELRFPSFQEAFAFMTGAALVAERMNHHPEWSNVYNRVVVELTTHDAGGITQNDMEFAKKAEGIAALLQGTAG
jgi:4a-hydroxytetrahydrobiopterin dehydratase